MLLKVFANCSKPLLKYLLYLGQVCYSQLSGSSSVQTVEVDVIDSSDEALAQRRHRVQLKLPGAVVEAGLGSS
jgi:hypothetical protein